MNHVGVLGYAYGRAGNRDRAKAHLEELTARAAQGNVSGDVERPWSTWGCRISRASSAAWSVRFEERDGSLILITAALEFDPMRNDPRFKSLLGQNGTWTPRRLHERQ